MKKKKMTAEEGNKALEAAGIKVNRNLSIFSQNQSAVIALGIHGAASSKPKKKGD